MKKAKKYKWGYECFNCKKIAFYFIRKPLRNKTLHGSNVIMNNKQMLDGDIICCQYCNSTPCELLKDKDGTYYMDFTYKNLKELK